jgi:V-type H+-transporting ATPase subunit H
VKEKVIRVIVATFRVGAISPAFAPYSSPFQNLVAKAPSANLPAMLVARLLPFAKNLSTRKWTDEDVVEDVNFLRDELMANFQSLTSVHPFSFHEAEFNTCP